MASDRFPAAAAGALVTALAALLAALLAVTLQAAPAVAATPPPPPPSWHPEEDGAHADHGARSDDAGQAGEGLPHGVDVSGHQTDVDWPAAGEAGARFAYVKATEGTDFQNDDFSSAYDGAAATGMLHGAYHFALPDRSDAATQATYLLDHGGAPSGDGRTLPPMLDIEDDPYGDQCYGMSPEDMVAWIRSFSDTVAARTHRLPTIYTSLRWWSACTGNSDALGDNPLFIAHYDEDVGTLPAGWEQETFWQYSDSGPLPGDQDVFHGTPEQLQALAADPSASSGSAGSTSSSTPPTSTSTSAPPSTPPSTTSTPPSTTTPSTTTPDSPA